MAEKNENYKIEVIRIEKGIGKKYKFIFKSENFGEYPIEMSEKYYSVFIPGKKYLGKFRISGIPDFIGEKDKFENICTVNYSLEKIIEKDNVIWEK